MIADSPAMFVEHLLYAPRVEESRTGQPGRLPSVTREIVEASDEPVRERHLESQLSRSDRPPRKQRLDCAPQHMLPHALTKLHLRRHRQRPVDELMRKEGDPRL